MKYLYKILRLFFCPHKYDKILAKGPVRDGYKTIGLYYDKECKYCGKIKAFTT
jgi:hypothetical protein